MDAATNNDVPAKLKKVGPALANKAELHRVLESRLPAERRAFLPETYRLRTVADAERLNESLSAHQAGGKTLHSPLTSERDATNMALEN